MRVLFHKTVEEYVWIYTSISDELMSWKQLAAADSDAVLCFDYFLIPSIKLCPREYYQVMKVPTKKILAQSDRQVNMTKQ